jgi:hypothetical protein
MLAVTAAIALMSFGILSKTGIAGYVESPGENNCAQCHGGSANSGKGSIVINAPTLTGWKYIPGQTYAINVTVAHSGVNLFGFAFEAISSAGTDAGILKITDGAQTYIDSSDLSATWRKSVTHKLNGGKSADSHTFTFSWTAPATNIGPVTFYSAGNAANGNNLATGDYIYTKTQVVSPLSSVGIAEQSTSNISIFPNPATDNLTIINTAKTTDKMIVSIVDMNGKLMFKKENAVSDLSIDVSTLSIGIYMAKIETEVGTIIKKFVRR